MVTPPDRSGEYNQEIAGTPPRKRKIGEGESTLRERVEKAMKPARKIARGASDFEKRDVKPGRNDKIDAVSDKILVEPSKKSNEDRFGAHDLYAERVENLLRTSEKPRLIKGSHEFNDRLIEVQKKYPLIPDDHVIKIMSSVPDENIEKFCEIYRKVNFANRDRFLELLGKSDQSQQDIILKMDGELKPLAFCKVINNFLQNKDNINREDFVESVSSGFVA